MTIRRKINNRKGFTLAETLLAVLILLLVSTIVAQGVPVARNVYQKVVLAANAQDMLATAVSALRDELGTSWDVQVGTDANSKTFVTYYSADTGARSKISLGTADDGATEEVKLQKNIAVSELGIAGYKTNEGYISSLVSDSGATDASRLYVKYGSVSYSEHKVTFANLSAGTTGSPNLATLDALTIDVFMDKES